MLLPDCSHQQKGVSVIAVIGIGGLGKTTLAQLVYNDDRVQKGFDLCMWACINYFSPLKQVLITLLESATKTQPEYLNIDQLQYKFRKEIEGKQFLLVLDDLWDEDHQNWRKLKHLLSSGKDGSKVLATTRSEIVAQSLCATMPYFDLKGMADESAWLLFKKVAFGDEGDQNSSEFEKLGRQIVRQCANVPLAIVTIASLLREKEKERWPLVTDELSKLFPDGHANIMKVLEFSYKGLLYQVKRCFGYCSLFPKDYKFDKDILVCLWIAQGFVEPLGNESLKDRGEEYLLYLVKRCFFQLVTGDKKKRSTVTYQMHDLMHDLAMEVAGSECILFDQSDDSSWDKTVHHVSMYCELESMVVDSVCSFSHSKRLRTFITHWSSRLKNDALKKLMVAFGSLRVLDLLDMGIKEVPTSIGGLIHLRFLDLSMNGMKRLPSSVCSLPHLQSFILRECTQLMELPKDLGNLLSLRLLDLSENNSLERLPRSICSLRHLQSLILRKCKHLKELPEELGDLVRLRHLVLKGCRRLVKMPPGLAALTSLVTLDKLAVHNPSGGLQYLERLDNLVGSLKIKLPPTDWESATTDFEKSSLSRKTRLHSLAIIRSEDFENRHCQLLMNAIQLPPNLQDLSIKDFGGKEILNGVSILHKLVILKLEGCKGVALPALSHLPSLKELCISDMYSMLTIEDSKVYEHSLFFPSLQTLSIMAMWKLKSWWLQAPTVLPTFPHLTRVTIHSCPKLTGCMPLFPTLVEYLCLGKVPTLVEDLRLGNVRENNIWPSTSSIAEVRRTHLPRVRHLEIATINRNLFKALKDLAFLETLTINNNFNVELQKEDEDGIRWENLHKLHSVSLKFGEGFRMRNNQRLLNGFQDLTSLKDLHLSYCKELYLSWRALLGLPHLWNVNIEYVEKVSDVDSDAMMIHTRPISRSIRQLRISWCSGEWIHDIPWKSLPSLELLDVTRMRNLKSLPEGIQHLSALEFLFIHHNPDVVSLPHWMSTVLSLHILHITGSSSELKERCERGTGEDWPNIQHITDIDIKIDTTLHCRFSLARARRFSLPD